MARRLTDIVLALVGLAVLAPLLVAIAAAVRLRDGAPVIYRARRVGLHGREFQLYKFRTMVPAGGSSVTVWADPRVTPLGRRLRRLKLDELPQLFNVLRGEMTMVGPRPEDPSYVALYTDEQRRVLSVKPGITGVAALEYADEESLLRGEDWEATYRLTIMPAKLQLELDYLARRTTRTDAGLILRTAAVVAGHLVPRR
jgi:lipopolysaccharide/colanic/teichoic acid biosynthesis glycosyltransferase